jgi:hypothetical protein
MSPPIGILLRDAVLGQQRFEQNQARRLDADPFADHVLGGADRVLLQREEAVRVLLHTHREALDRQALGHRQHDGGAGRHLAGLEATGGHDGDSIDVRSAGLDVEVDAFLLEVAQLLRDYLADLVATDQPAQLHVDCRFVGCQCLHAEEGTAACCDGPEGSGTAEEAPAACIRRVVHVVSLSNVVADESAR